MNRPPIKRIVIHIDRSRLRWFVVFVAVFAALVSFGVAIRAHNNTIAAKDNLCTAANIFTLFLNDEAILRSNEADVTNTYQVREDRLVNSTLQFWRGLAAGSSDAFLTSAIHLRDLENKYRNDRISADLKLIRKHVLYWNTLATTLHDESNCGKAVIG